MTREDLVKEFNEAFNLPVAMAPDVGICTGDMQLCLQLIREEYRELEEVMYEYTDGGDTLDRENLLKELADLQYVVSGFAVRMGLNLEEAFQRVHRSNMSKLGEDGKPIYNDDGKVMKGPNYKAPDLSDLV